VKIAILHRYPKDQIKQTNAAFPYLASEGVDVLTYRAFTRLNDKVKFLKSVFWVIYAPFLVITHVCADYGKKYDVIYCDDSFPFYAGLVKLVCPRSKVVKRMGDFHLMYYTSGLLYEFLHFFEKIEWRMLDMIIAISGVMAEKIHEEIGRAVEVVPDPVDLNDFPYFDVPHERPRIMFHGLLTRNKNVDVFLEAARMLLHYDFWIVGDGPDRERLESIAPTNVWFLGWKPFKDMYAYIGSCDIGVALRGNNPGNEYVVTSPYLQYSIKGKPCLVTRRKVFGNYEWQFSSGAELAGKIVELLKWKENEGQANRMIILEKHDARKVASQIWCLLQY